MSMSDINDVLSNPMMNFSLAIYILSPTNVSLLGTTKDLIGGPPIVLLSALFQGSSETDAATTILHELAHFGGVFGAESVPGNPSSADNDQTIAKDCSKTLFGQ